MKNKIVIIGAGTYGSYLANSLSEKFPAIEIHLIEAGNDTTQSEQEIGFIAKVKSENYKATSDGRFFGLGGTSAKWGGQLLFYSNRDFANPGGMQSLIDCNLKYRKKVLTRFFKTLPVLEEEDLGSGLFSRKGVWLKFSQRNMFTHFKIADKKNIIVHQNALVSKLNVENGKITSVQVQFDGAKESEKFIADSFYLTTGAFESLRLMHVSGLVDISKSSQGFSDHVSMRCFQIHSSDAKIGGQDLQFRFENGSMITSRLIGEKEGVSYYIQPVFNEGFVFFQLLKQLLFKGKFSLKLFISAAAQFYVIFPFVYSFLVKKKLYIYKEWFLNIDMELSKSTNSVSMASETDRYGQNGINIHYSISDDSIRKLKEIKEIVAEMLRNENIHFSEVSTNVSTLKLEDTYHPYRLFAPAEDKELSQLFQPLSNLCLINTGLLQRAGGINPTAALFCWIEQHIECMH